MAPRQQSKAVKATETLQQKTVKATETSPPETEQTSKVNAAELTAALLEAKEAAEAKEASSKAAVAVDAVAASVNAVAVSVDAEKTDKVVTLLAICKTEMFFNSIFVWGDNSGKTNA